MWETLELLIQLERDFVYKDKIYDLIATYRGPDIAFPNDNASLLLKMEYTIPIREFLRNGNSIVIPEPNISNSIFHKNLQKKEIAKYYHYINHLWHAYNALWNITNSPGSKD